ncbi:MAG: transporter substrate-binding domain-containing protein [Burkholderiales bacterium]|nr:transporter substrate-binding domain-containing protein [Burkholderiales bacterium]
MKPFRFSALLLLAFVSVTSHAGQTLVINSSYYPPFTTTEQTGFLDLFYKELGKRAGLTFKIQTLPAERALGNANSGIDDGDVCRIAGLDKTYPNLVQVSEPILSYKMKVFSRKANFTVHGAESLKPYDVGILTGWKIIERTVVGTRSLSSVETIDQLIKMLQNEKVDIIVIEEMQGRTLMKKMGANNLKTLQPSLLEGEWYPYLNKKHADLIPQITVAIKSMKQDGTYQKLYNATINKADWLN